ncbi:MAG TPA: molybdopterin-dependent oxidoreductase [Deltaproteobacteria bacterium]|nr:molybdopterin-dependent oxidoreductase [Deltaproteobacteria bacterium]HRW79545.1 molybdopterin-dependent oxidoreductase [Desulfomonilia bacterium]HNQ85821.1 molybdopterin-dependent oxidoreductase [Deltaproteobacteria bacterium]HNS90010.1 molybdopterin-dependent oxidoreductase [Deltaproteobacteria bacterium]HOA44800.1 molybdopterin-dependent oxidoreductase [Deltaproteobacteria bacterium]
MGEWRKTGCVLCAQNCGLEVYVEDNRITKSRGDKDNPRSQGYVCRKGANVAFHQHHTGRLTHPLKRVGSTFEKISWDQAIGEIASRIRQVTGEHGPKSYVYMGGGGQGCHFDAAFGVRLMRALGSRYHYNPLGQELTGIFWASGRFTGRQYLFGIPDEHAADMILAIGWNGMQSHQMPRAPLVLKEFSKNPDKLLVVIDPRKSETAEIADIHLAVRPGTDALLTRAMIAIILAEGWQDMDYIEQHTTGFEEVAPWFRGFDARAACAVCGLDYEQVREVCRLLATRKWCMHTDLGIYMNRHSTVASYLHLLLAAVCGRFCARGGNVIPGHLMPLGAHTDERDSKTWRTVTTDFPALMGVFPPNVLPEEILSEHPDRTRIVMCCQSNPLRSFADTTAYEEAFRRLDLLVTCELAMTETAALSHYVLPALSGYESWDGTFFPWTFPEVYFQMRRPVVEPVGEPLHLSEILVRIADALGIIPAVPQSLVDAAAKDRMTFGMELMQFIQANPKTLSDMPFILAKTLGRTMGSPNLAALWGLLQAAPKSFRKAAARAGFKPGITLGDEVFQSILDHPEGVIVGLADPDDNFSMIAHEDHLIHVHIPEMEGWVKSIEPESEEAALKPDPDFPLVLQAGRHMSMNANTLMRDPAWNEGRRACTLAVHPDDASSLDITDGQMVRVITEAGEVAIEAEITEATRRGQVIMPHGFGMVHQGKVYGANVNRLTKNTNRDRFAATPHHRYVPCRIEPLEA